MLARIYAEVRWFLEQIGEQFVENGLLNSAAALTYTTLFAVVPLMTVGYVMLSVLPAFSGVSDQIQNFVFDNFVPESSALIQDKLNDFSSQARGLTLAVPGLGTTRLGAQHRRKAILALILCRCLRC